MWTLTVDPKRFQDPEHAYQNVMSGRFISRLVRDLRKAGVLHGRHYFWVLEFHKSGWPHWHLILDATYISHCQFQSIWNRLGGCEDRPLGWVSFSKGLRSRGNNNRFVNRKHCADYITKYIIKEPERGWPEWLLEYPGNVHRYGRSRGMFAELGDEKRGKTSPVGEERVHYKRKRSVRLRIAECGRETVVYMQRPLGGWSRMAFAPIDIDEMRNFFQVEGTEWEIPGPGLDSYIDCLIWSYAGLSDLPRCRIRDGHLELSEWDPELAETAADAYFDIVDSSPPSFASEVIPVCGPTLHR